MIVTKPAMKVKNSSISIKSILAYSLLFAYSTPNKKPSQVIYMQGLFGIFSPYMTRFATGYAHRKWKICVKN